MKHFLYFLMLSGLLVCCPGRSNAQAEELEQLALDTEKLAQMKNILNEMYKGYQILTNGYNAVKSLAEGNFNLHSTYLTGLLSVSPAVRNYVRVADIMSLQIQLVSETKSTVRAAIGAGAFSANEVSYMSSVCTNLVTKSLENLDELSMVLTDNVLRANDAERIASIDRIYKDLQDKLVFIHAFSQRVAVLASQRKHQQNEMNYLRNLYGH